jgi:hypothetical protein
MAAWRAPANGSGTRASQGRGCWARASQWQAGAGALSGAAGRLARTRRVETHDSNAQLRRARGVVLEEVRFLLLLRVSAC